MTTEQDIQQLEVEMDDAKYNIDLMNTLLALTKNKEFKKI